MLSFRRPLKPEGGLRPQVVTRFTHISLAVALKSVKVYLFGLPVGGMTAFHKRAD